MKVSIITPSLNSGKYIENNLKSVHLGQNDDFSVEQIIIDGGSTDQTLNIINNFKTKYNANIKLIQGKDKSMYDAINKGLKSMDGDIWACLNTDDLYYPGIINLVVKEFNKNPELDVVYGYPDMIDENGEFIHTLYLPKFDLEFLVLRGYCLTILQPASFLHKRVLDKVGYFDITYKYASDYDYFIRVGSKCKMELVRKSFTQFREHPAAITCNEKTRSVQTEETISISKKYMDEFKIKQRSLLLDNLKLYLRQVSFKNFRYMLERTNELTRTGSWRWFLKERIR
ncbi:Dolichyl N-acetyl-alpha-D-glucosaminyl phosphate 3-beta-D-2,3-diacetamido-2,3-dideoxy-beta-D-glucuronosyltransferase [uncultured archaeon]|nr:Dolichyl N-acetyl-alpha-D-glucosaminyl phosphate 3-beta-D-2,3-diacetamido-2,3-dideoxy-beta-D-glucuronosyltransferase [uncultured archaeon]